MHFAILVRFVLAVALMACLTGRAAADLTEEMQARLQAFVDDHGRVVFLALSCLPESQPAFVEVFGKTLGWWHSEGLEDFDGMLSPDQKQEARGIVAKKLARMTVSERERFFARLNKWVIAYDQVKICERMADGDRLMEAFVSLPATRLVFDMITQSRHFDPSTVTPQMIVETMTSSEWGGCHNDAVTALSSLSDAELMAYFRDLFTLLMEMTPQGSGGR
jgi:hypothetical protein